MPRGFCTPQSGDQHIGIEKIPLDEAAERAAHPLLVVGDDRGVRDGEAERPAEERGDGEPVGDPAHDPRLRGGADEQHPEIRFGHEERPDEDESRRGKEACSETAVAAKALPRSVLEVGRELFLPTRRRFRRRRKQRFGGRVGGFVHWPAMSDSRGLAR
jgi:hypothetical protein